MRRHSEKRTTIKKYQLTPADRIEILWKSVTTATDEYDFYDIKYGGIVITGCTIREGSKGDFLAAPSHKKDDEYVREVYFSDDFSESILKYIEDADKNDKWKSVSNDYYLKAR